MLKVGKIYGLREKCFLMVTINNLLFLSKDRNVACKEQFPDTHVQHRRYVVWHCHNLKRILNIDSECKSRTRKKEKKLLIHILKLSPIELQSSSLLYFQAITRRESAA